MSGAAGRNFQCSDCAIDPTRKEVWGCNEQCKMSRPTMADGGIEYWSCPVRFIPPSVWSFVKIRKFYQDHPSSPFPAYEDVSPRWREAERIIDTELMQYMRIK